jgi:hypothetical protein
VGCSPASKKKATGEGGIEGWPGETVGSDGGGSTGGGGGSTGGGDGATRGRGSKGRRVMGRPTWRISAGGASPRAA